MAHIPLIHGADGAKLSKRHGALGVEAYRAMGYLPEALRNYLARLGWSHGDDEIMSLDDMIDWFEIEDVNKGAARFDFAEARGAERHLHAPDGRRRADSTSLVAPCPIWTNGKAILDRLDERRTRAAAGRHAGLKERAKTLVELADGAAFLFAERPLPLDEKAAALLGAMRSKRDPARRACRRCRRRRRLERSRRRSRDPRLCRRERPEARRGRAAAARRADRTQRPRPASSTCWRCSAARKAWRGSAIRID